MEEALFARSALLLGEEALEALARRLTAGCDWDA